jgi:hypothetical protein
MGESILTPPQARSLVEHLIAWLDLVDGDADLEEGSDAEPSLGALEGHDDQVGIAWDATWLGHGSHDREEECHDEGVTA